MKVSKVIIVQPEPEEPERTFKVRPPAGRFKVKRIPKEYRHLWFTPISKKRVISIRDLPSDQEFCFDRYFPDNGGYRNVVATGEALQRSWARALKRATAKNGIDRFMAAFFRRPAVKPVGRWRVVVLHPRKDLYMLVQPVNKQHYAAAKARYHP